MANCCPTCGRTVTVRKLKTAGATEASMLLLAGIDTGRMSLRDVHAHYARLAPFMDVYRFIESQTGYCSADLLTEARTLLDGILAQDGKHTPASKRAYRLLHQHWRAERDATPIAIAVAA